MECSSETLLNFAVEVVFPVALERARPITAEEGIVMACSPSRFQSVPFRDSYARKTLPLLTIRTQCGATAGTFGVCALGCDSPGRYRNVAPFPADNIANACGALADSEPLIITPAFVQASAKPTDCTHGENPPSPSSGQYT